MSNENIQINVTDQGSTRIVQRNLDDLGNSGDTAADSIDNLNKKLSSTPSNVVPSMKDISDAFDGVNFSSAAVRREVITLFAEFQRADMSRFYSSLTTLANRMGLAEAAVVTLGSSVLALAIPIALIGALMLQGANQQKAMSDALILTGDYANQTADSLYQLAEAATVSGGTIGQAKAAVTELAASGKFTGDQIGLISHAAVAMQAAAGVAVAQTVSDFEKLADVAVTTSGKTSDAVSAAALRQNETSHYLTESIYEQIRALEAQGKTQDAVALSVRAYASAELERADEIKANLGTIAALWNAVKVAASDALNDINNIGKKATPDSQLKQVQFRLQVYDPTSRDNTVIEDHKRDLAQLAVLQAATNAETKKASDASATATTQAQGLTAANAVLNLQTTLERKSMSELNLALQDYHNDIKAIAAANPNSVLVTPSAVAQMDAAITKAHTVVAKGQDDRKQQEADQLLQIKTQTDAERDLYNNRLSMLDLYHQKLGMSDGDFYAGVKNSRDQYVAAEAVSYQKELDIINNFQSKSPNEVAQQKVKLDALTLQHQTFLDKMQAATTVDSVNQIAETKAVEDAGQAAQDKYVAGLQEQLNKLNQSNAAHIESKSVLSAETDAALKLAIANTEVTNSMPITDIHTKEDVAIGQQSIANLKTILSVNQQITASLVDQENIAAKSKLITDTIQEWKNAGQVISQTLENAFGSVGKSIDALFKSYADGVTGQLQITKQLMQATQGLAKNSPAAVQATQQAQFQSAQLQLKTYGDLSQAAAGFFNVQSTGYKTLMAVSEVYHAAELAMSLAELVPKGIAAVLNQGQGDPYSAFERMAAMAALVVGLGVAIGSAVGSHSSGQTAAQVQASQGTGTVLGSATTQSQSIANSLTAIKAATVNGLDVSNGMLTQLEAINTGIQNLGNVIGQQYGVSTGSLDSTVATGTKPLLPTTGTVGSLGAAGFLVDALGSTIALIGGKLFNTTTSIVDQGIQLSAQTLGSAITGVVGNIYDTVDSSTKIFGVSVSSSTNKVLGALPDEISQQFTAVIGAMRGGILAAVNILGVGGDDFTKQLDAITLSLGDVSLKGLDPTQVTAALNAVFSKLGDQLAQGVGTIIPQLGAMITEFQQAGEGQLQTLTRLAEDYSAVNAVMATMGVTFANVGLASIPARENLITLSGGLTQFTSQAAEFTKDFLSTAEQTAALQKQLDPLLQTIDPTLTTESATAMNDFKNAILNAATAAGSADATVAAAGAQTYASLMSLAPAFSQVEQAMAAAKANTLSLQETLLQDQGKTYEALTLKRNADLAAMSATDAAIQRQINAQEDLNVQNQLGITLLQAQYRTQEATNLQRQQTLAGLSAEQAALQSQIYAVQDAQSAVDSAFSQVTAAINAAKTAVDAQYNDQVAAIQAATQAQTDSLTAQSTAAQQALSDIQAVFSTLSSSVDTIAQTMPRQVAEGILSSALSYSNGGGSLVNYANLSNALQVVSQPSENLFSSFQDYQRDQAQTSNTILALKNNAGAQVSVAQLTLDAINASSTAITNASNAQLATLSKQHDANIAALDAIQTQAQTQVDALRGIDDSVLSVGDAINNLAAAIGLAQTLDNQGSSVTSGVGSTSPPSADMIEENGVWGYPSQFPDWSTTLGLNTGAAGSPISSTSGSSASATIPPHLVQNIKVPSLDVGTNYVTGNTLALIHDGERVMPKADNSILTTFLANYTQQWSTGGDDDLAEEIAAMREDMNKLLGLIVTNTESTAKQSEKTATILDNNTAGGGPMLVEISQ